VRKPAGALRLFGLADLLPEPTLAQVHRHLKVGVALRWVAIGLVAAGGLMLPGIPGLLPVLVMALIYNALATAGVALLPERHFRRLALTVTIVDQVFCFLFLGMYSSKFGGGEPLAGYFVVTIEGVGYFGAPGALLSIGMFLLSALITQWTGIPLFQHMFDNAGIAGAALLLTLPAVALVSVLRTLLPDPGQSLAHSRAPSHGVPNGKSPVNGSTRQVRLSKREREVLGLVAEGYSNAMIANRLGLSDATVKSYVENLLVHLNARNRAEAVAAAARLNLL
jgi:DNA-binding CsgD family transcriptional regulator